jgi:hypothetical protein
VVRKKLVRAGAGKSNVVLLSHIHLKIFVEIRRINTSAFVTGCQLPFQFATVKDNF